MGWFVLCGREFFLCIVLSSVWVSGATELAILMREFATLAGVVTEDGFRSASVECE